VGNVSNWPKVTQLMSSLSITTKEISDGNDDWQLHLASVVDTTVNIISVNNIGGAVNIWIVLGHCDEVVVEAKVVG